MTKKDYVLIAGALRYVKPQNFVYKQEAYKNRLTAWQNCVVELTMAFANDNPRFDKIRFQEACGMMLSE